MCLCVGLHVALPCCSFVQLTPCLRASGPEAGRPICPAVARSIARTSWHLRPGCDPACGSPALRLCWLRSHRSLSARDHKQTQTRWHDGTITQLVWFYSLSSYSQWLLKVYMETISILSCIIVNNDGPCRTHRELFLLPCAVSLAKSHP